MKFLSNNNRFVSPYFWGTYTGAELDYMEEKNGVLTAYEIKFKKAHKKATKIWWIIMVINFNTLHGIILGSS